MSGFSVADSAAIAMQKFTTWVGQDRLVRQHEGGRLEYRTFAGIRRTYQTRYQPLPRKTHKGIIFTGGAGKDEPVAESVVASQYAIQHGVAVQDIYCETISRLTYENLCGARTLIQREHIRRVLIVSDPLHMRRAITIARDLGMNAYPSPTPTSRYISLSSKLDFLWGEGRPYTTYLLRRLFRNIIPEGTEAYPCK
jgi:uncharacterized SAM-binding protein YcdF (DUF218 family)